MNGYVKCFDNNNKHINFLVHDKEVLNKYNKTWDKIEKFFGKKFDREPVYNDKYIKTKINLYNINFYDNKLPKENECYNCVPVILLDSIFVNSNKEYYPKYF